MSNPSSRTTSPFHELFSGDYKNYTTQTTPPRTSSRSSSPFDDLLSGDYKKNTAPTTPPRSKNTGPKGLTPMKKSFKGLVSEGDKLKKTISTRINSSGSSLLGDDTNDLDEFKKIDQEYHEKLKSNKNFLKFSADARRIREEKEARMKKYREQGKTDEEIAKLERRRLFAKNVERYGNTTLTKRNGGKTKKRKTRKNNKRKKRTQKKNKRKNKKSKRKTRK